MKIKYRVRVADDLLGVNTTIVLDFPGTLRPVPKATRDLRRQPTPQLAGKHHNLSPVMAFVRDEITEQVPHVEGKIAPHISRRGGNASPVITTKLQQAQNARAATLQRWNQTLGFHLVPVDAARHSDAVFLAERLDPHTSGIVNVTGKHPDSATRCSRHLGLPEFGGQMLNQKGRDAIIGFPRVKDRISQVGWRTHTFLSRRLDSGKLNSHRCHDTSGAAMTFNLRRTEQVKEHPDAT